MASQAPPSATAPEHLQNDNNQSLKGNDYQQQDSGPKLQNGGQINPPPNADQHGKSIKSPPSNGNSGVGPPNEMMPGPGYHHDPNLGPPSQPGQHHNMHHAGPGDKDEMSQQPPHHHQQHPMYGHQPMHGHPMHGPPPQQHIPGHHLPMHPHQQRYHPHQAGPHGPPHGMQHPMHPHDPNQQQQMDPYGHHYRGMMPARPPQRYGLPPQGVQGPVPPQNTQNVPSGAQQPPPGAQQGPTPTLNSLLQSQPSPQQQGAPPQQQGAPHRYPNPGPYDPYGPPVSGNGPPPIPPNSGPSSPMPTLSQSQQQQQQQQQSWAPPPRPYSPQQYRGPPPANTSRGQSPYPSSGQSPGPYPSGPPPNAVPTQQQSNQAPGPPMPPQQYQYPQRYPTPPANQGPQQSMGPQNHRPPYSQWPSPAASPGPHSNLGPPTAQSPHAPPPQSPGPQQQQQLPHSNAPCSPSPQPPQSPHQYPNRPSQPSTPSTNDNEVGVNQKKKSTTTKKKTKKQQKQEAAAAAQNSSIENSTNLAANNQQSAQQPPNNVSSQPGPGAQSLPQNNQQQSMRPISSPNSSSSGSRSMSPAVGQNLPMPPRPSSSHSQQGIPPIPGQQQQQQQLNQGSNQGVPLEGQMTSPGPQNSGPPMQGYPGQPAPHMQQHGAYKMGPYPPQSQYSQGNYSPRAQYTGYGNQQGPPGPPNSPGQYRPMHNHVGPPGPHSGHPQYPPHPNYPQVWPAPPQNNPGAMPNHIQGKNIGPPPPQSPQVQQQQPPQQAGNSPRQLNYLKQHLQHKGGYSQGTTPPPQGYGNGPGIHPSMGPPTHHMGPPTGPASSMGPPPASTGTPPSHMENPVMQMPPNIHHPEGMPPQDNGMPPTSHQVTSLITTGPDGTPLDEASQQSTLSNTSIASGEDPQQSTPKSRKSEMMYNHPMTPAQTNASPGASGHPHSGEDFEMGSPPWPRTPASPVFNSHAAAPVTPQDSYRSTKVKKSDSLAKLYEMDENPERRMFLDKLLGYMDEIRKPVTACPTISKQPLDLYRLYLYVKERGGFMEVCKVTKSKTWKDVAGLLGIGASSSAAYTLRKHYIKSILPYECQFDRGGIDPGPIIQSVEAGAKKKTTKAASVPSPGSSNSQDSFPAPGSGGGSMDGYAGYPGQQYPPTAAGQPDYVSPMQRPPSQTNAQTPHPTGNAPPNNDNISVSNPFEDPVAPRPPYQQHTGAQYPPVTRPQGPYPGQYQATPPFGPPEQQAYGPHNAGQYPPPQAQNQFPNNRQMYPPYGPEGEPNFRSPGPPTNDAYRGYAGHGYAPPPGSQQQGPRPPYVQQPQSQQSVTPGAGPSPHSHSQPAVPSVAGPPISAAPSGVQQQLVTPAIANSNAPANQQPAQGMPPVSVPQNYPPTGPPPSQEYYNRPDQNAQPRRHPDFTKETNQQPYPPYGGQRPPQMYGGWPPNASGAQYRPQYPPQTGPQQWAQGPRPGQPQGPNQWDQPRYPVNQQYGPNQQWPGQGGSPLMRPPQRGGKPFAMPPPQGPQPINKMPNQYGPHGPSHMQQISHHSHQVQHMQGHPQGPQFQQGPQGMSQKRDMIFPPDTVEATQPMLYRRKRMSKHDVGPVDPWRIFMSLRSGLLAESTWAIDVLNVLLFDDSSVAYFGLIHLPGLLTLLLEHFQKSLADMFETKTMTNVAAIKDASDEECNKNGGDNNKLSSNLISNSDTGDTRCNKNDIHMPANREEDDSSVDLGAVTDIPNPNEHLVVLKSTFNYTMQSRKGVPVKLQDSSNDIFVMDNHRNWDKTSNRDCFLKATVGDDPFNVGQEPNSIEYIMNSFKAEYAHIPFARFIKTTKNSDGSEKPRKTTEPRPSLIKRMRLSSEEEREVEDMTRKLYNPPMKPPTINVVLKKENNSDADCRQVDMELEKLTNGPTPENGISEKEIKSEKEEESEKDVETGFNVRETLRDPAKSLKRKRVSDYEDECYTRDEASLHLITDSQDSLARRCICLSTILRNLTFVPGNELEFAKSTTFLSVLGKLLLINHEHPIRTKKQRNYDREEDADFSDSCSSLQGENEWWWDFLVQIRENMLVAIANISGYLDLSIYDEPVSRPVLDGLLHWAVCPSAHGQDPFSTMASNSLLSPQRLALEALCKLCVTDSNVDLVIATPPFSRLEKLCAVLTKHLCKNEDQVLREFSVNLLHYLASSDSAMARTVAKQSPCVSYLVAFIEQAEQTALGVANQHGINFLRENPDSMGTSLDMLRRAAGTLLHLAKHPDNRPLFMQQEQRLLGLVMSHILDQQVALIISRVLYQTSRGSGPLTTTQQMEQSTELVQQKPNQDGPKDSETLEAPLPEPKLLPPPMAAPSPQQQVQPQQFTQMKSPALPPPTFPPAPSKLLNSNDDVVKSKLNTINKQLPNASNIATTTAPSSTPAIPQTVTASS